MLTLERFHLTLTRVQDSDIELIREGRNRDHVRLNHLHQTLITPEQQQAWFQGINNDRNYFFMIGSRGQQVGIVYVSRFSAARRGGNQPGTDHMATSNCGVFIWEPTALSSKIPLLAVLTVLDFFFGDLRGGSTESVVLKSNTAALKMNTFFGFLVEDVPGTEHCRVFMDLERYLENRPRLLKFAQRVVKDPDAFALRLGGTPSPLNFDVINERLVAGAR